MLILYILIILFTIPMRPYGYCHIKIHSEAFAFRWYNYVYNSSKLLRCSCGELCTCFCDALHAFCTPGKLIIIHPHLHIYSPSLCVCCFLIRVNTMTIFGEQRILAHHRHIIILGHSHTSSALGQMV